MRCVLESGSSVTVTVTDYLACEIGVVPAPQGVRTPRRSNSTDRKPTAGILPSAGGARMGACPPDCGDGRTCHRRDRTARATADGAAPGGRAHGQADVTSRHGAGRGPG